VNRLWGDYGLHAFARVDRNRMVAVLPVASVAQHGPHLPLATDMLVLDGLIAAAVPLLPESVPAVFLPTQPVGFAVEHARYPGTLSLSAETLLRVLGEIGASVAQAGVKRLLMLECGLGQIAVLDIAARDLRVRHDMVAVAASCLSLGLPDEVVSAQERRHGIHAGQIETAMMLALRPDLVETARARHFDSLSERLERNFRHLGVGPVSGLGWQAQDLNPAGAVGDASAATAETGQRIVDHVARRLVELIEDVHRLPVSLLHNPTEI
jgi:creatinine amidohydrolase